jgi:hypothetical protein
VTDECRQERDELIMELNNRMDIQQKLINNHAHSIDGLNTSVIDNTAKVDCLIKSTEKLEKSVEPMIDILHTIQESVKGFGWIVKAVKWIGTIALGIGASMYTWTEHAHHFFKGQ